MTTAYFATTARGLEDLAARELESLGAVEVQPVFTGVKFSGDKQLLYKVNLWSRLVFRVLVPIADIASKNAGELYDNVAGIDWGKYLNPNQTLVVHCTGTNGSLNHTHFSALQIKNAIVDQQRQQTGTRSSVDKEWADISINAHIEGDRCTLSLDSSGESLHRRGYHPAMGVAPLKETLAAALLDLAGWTPDIPFLDPCCGSGTLAIEAALKSIGVAPGLYRRFGLENWPDFDRQLWSELVTAAKQQQKEELTAPIFASDADKAMIDQSYTNASFCHLEDKIQFTCESLEDLYPPTDTGIIVCNPPYGKRVGDVETLRSFYRLMGDIFKQRFRGWTAFILTGNKELGKQVGLRTSARIPVYNGSLPCTLLKYELY
ncbi:MAG: Ribosomal RNA large subunit methyltransferase K/L [Chroococcopsis gigantea SAG 12.99]|jgi:putative N6-adenine-specific DNA methylase|nr:RNA methyltransferase [Chlorogloea purpurea SAG 13.99]MDV3000980.1 Ribosomal RNA large subunit methyltransferase K/L [Chroococcopsis gigantea SAG 12.99]